MAAVKHRPHIAGSDWGMFPRSRSGPGDQAWRKVPRSHWRYWLGYRWRRHKHHYNGVSYFIYQTDRQRAKQALEEQYGRREPEATQGRRAKI